MLKIFVQFQVCLHHDSVWMLLWSISWPDHTDLGFAASPIYQSFCHFSSQTLDTFWQSSPRSPSCFWSNLESLSYLVSPIPSIMTPIFRWNLNQSRLRLPITILFWRQQISYKLDSFKAFMSDCVWASSSFCMWSLIFSYFWNTFLINLSPFFLVSISNLWATKQNGKLRSISTGADQRLGMPISLSVKIAIC